MNDHKPVGLDCPRCQTHYSDRPGALCRRDDQTMICQDCGTIEALEALARAESETEPYQGHVYWQEKFYCDWCGLTYQPDFTDQKFCSTKCATARQTPDD